MAALLYLGEYVHVQHLWRRSRGAMDDPLAVAWWSVCVAAVEGNDNVVMSLLQDYTQNHPEPLNHYAAHVQMAYQARRLDSKSKAKKNDGTCDSTKIVAFLETTKWNA
jgi:hypothetical protein